MLARIASTLALGLSLAVLAGCAGKQEAAARRQGEAVPVTAQVVQAMQWSDTLQALVDDAEWHARAQARPSSAQLEESAHGLGRELFGGMRRTVRSAEEGAITWL